MTYRGMGLVGLGEGEIDPTLAMFTAPIEQAPESTMPLPPPPRSTPKPGEPPPDEAHDTLAHWSSGSCINAAALSFLAYLGRYPNADGPSDAQNALVRAGARSPSYLRTLYRLRSCTVGSCLRAADLAAVELCLFGKCDDEAWLAKALRKPLCPTLKRGLRDEIDREPQCSDEPAFPELQAYCSTHGFAGPLGGPNAACFRYIAAGRLDQLMARGPCGGSAPVPGGGGPATPKPGEPPDASSRLPDYGGSSDIVSSAAPAKPAMSHAMMWGLAGVAALVVVGGVLIVKRSS